MLLPTHLAGGYLVARVWLARHPAATPRVSRLTLVVAMVAGILPDLDLLYFWWQVGDAAFGARAGDHRQSFLHTPFFALALGLIGAGVWREKLPALAAATGVLSHLVLDVLTIGFGVMWLYPFSRELFGLNLVVRLYGDSWGDHWLQRYVQHPLFLSEIAIVAVAVGLAWRARRSVDPGGH